MVKMKIWRLKICINLTSKLKKFSSGGQSLDSLTSGQLKV